MNYKKHDHLVDKQMYLTAKKHNEWFGKIYTVYCTNVDFIESMDLPWTIMTKKQFVVFVIKMLKKLIR